MIYFSHIRAGLIASALLLTTALASPALAESLPEISPRQIASDVQLQNHPETGAKEYLAPSFDPFEEDPNMAGAVNLRSVSNVTTIDGQPVRGGALLDMSFYYNSTSDDPYDTRGFEQAVYLSGEYAPVTIRDNRILECNERVQDVVYYHEDYYRPSLYGNLYRPYPFYSGHFGFGQSYGFNYGRSRGGIIGFSSFRGLGSSRSRFNTGRRSLRNRRNNTERNVGRAVDRERRGNREERRANRDERRTNGAEGTRNRDRTEARRDRRQDRRTSQTRGERAPRNRSNSFTGNAARRLAPRLREQSSSAPRTAPAPRSAPAPRAERAAPAPRKQSSERSRPTRTKSSRPARTERSRPSRSKNSANRARANKTRNAPRRNVGRKGNARRKIMGFLPMASAWSRNVVRNVDVQCAREEILTVHIPQERLDAARFDGLTILVLDRAGAEVPVFIPPNYIEGFRQAVNGRVTPSVSYQEPRTPAPVTRAPVYQEPRPFGIEEAPCPAGTAKQNDGTCLQGGTNTYGGYPTR